MGQDVLLCDATAGARAAHLGEVHPMFGGDLGDHR
jgi:hypothetical protein